MHSIRGLLITTLLIARLGASAQEGSQFDFLKSFPQSGDYRIEKAEHFPEQAAIHFLNEADFYRAQFESKANFFAAQFDGEADFLNAQFDGKANFSITKFEGDADFSITKFEGETSFFFATFEGHADFKRAEFEDRADFSVAEFRDEADFSNAAFKGRVSFFGTILPDTLIFESVKTSSLIDLTGTRLDSAKHANGRFCFIDLRDAPIEKFKLRYDKFRVYWPAIIYPVEYERLTYVYEGLLKNFKEHGYLTSYATLDLEYQAFRDLQNPNATYWKNLVNHANRHWNNYGYNKERIWLWTLLLLAISTLANWLAFPYMVREVYPVSTIDAALFQGKPWKRNQFRGWAVPGTKGKVRLNVKHFKLAFFYTTLIFFGLKISTERINYRKTAGVVLLYLEYVAGLICLGYLANFIISSGLIGQ